jgi:hypothetical protein
VEDAIRSFRPHLPETIELTLSLDEIHLSSDAELSFVFLEFV